MRKKIYAPTWLFLSPILLAFGANAQHISDEKQDLDRCGLILSGADGFYNTRISGKDLFEYLESDPMTR